MVKRSRSNYFQKGNTYHLLRSNQPGPSSQTGEENGSISTTDNTLSGDRTYNLRQRDTDQDVFKGNRIVSMSKLVFSINQLVKSHNRTRCRAPQITFANEVKAGLGIKLQFKCNSCGYLSEFFKMYEEIKDTRGAAVLNTNLAVALMDSPMGVSRAEDLFTQLDLPFPAASHMHELCKQVSKKIVKINSDDMAEKREIVTKHNISIGSKDPKQLDLSIDARYNSQRMISSYKPGQSSSQAYTIATENHTEYKFIVAMSVENKLCMTGASLRYKGLDVFCPGGHAGCSADLEYFTPHSERKMAYNVAEDLYKDGFLVRTLTTDGDTKSQLGMQDFYRTLDDVWNVTRQADPNHLSVCQERKVRNVNFSEKMFPFNTKRDRQTAQGKLGNDIRMRCNAIIEEMARRGQGDITKMLKDLPSIRSSTVDCYAGNCSNCANHSLVCDGVSTWWHNSKVLGPANITYLRMTENDKALLEVILQMRLSEGAIYSVSSRTSTQKCEAFNRAASATLSKNINYSRTFTGRLSAQILRSNNTLDIAVRKKLWKISGTGLGVWAKKRLQQISLKRIKDKLYRKTDTFKRNRLRRRALMEFQHREVKKKRNINEIQDYIKGVANDDIHNYAQTVH